jgi:hypothetical protein
MPLWPVLGVSSSGQFVLSLAGYPAAPERAVQRGSVHPVHTGVGGRWQTATGHATMIGPGKERAKHERNAAGCRPTPGAGAAA